VFRKKPRAGRSVDEAFSLGDGWLARRAQRNTEKNLTDAIGRLDRVMVAIAKKHDLLSAT
jgi:hypothetical protein